MKRRISRYSAQTACPSRDSSPPLRLRMTGCDLGYFEFWNSLSQKRALAPPASLFLSLCPAGELFSSTHLLYPQRPKPATLDWKGPKAKKGQRRDLPCPFASLFLVGLTTGHFYGCANQVKTSISLRPSVCADSLIRSLVHSLSSGNSLSMPKARSNSLISAAPE